MSNKNTYSERIQKARSEFLHSCTADSMRNNFRNKLFGKMKNNRSTIIDRFRQIVEDFGDSIVYESLAELRKVLESDPAASNLIQETEVDQLLHELEQEIGEIDLQAEGNQYIKDTQTETDDIINRHLITCKLCHTLNSEEEICRKCCLHLQHDFAN